VLYGRVVYVLSAILIYEFCELACITAFLLTICIWQHVAWVCKNRTSFNFFFCLFLLGRYFSTNGIIRCVKDLEVNKHQLLIVLQFHPLCYVTPFLAIKAVTCYVFLYGEGGGFALVRFWHCKSTNLLCLIILQKSIRSCEILNTVCRKSIHKAIRIMKLENFVACMSYTKHAQLPFVCHLRHTEAYVQFWKTTSLYAAQT
jgi:hypothetical protein